MKLHPNLRRKQIVSICGMHDGMNTQNIEIKETLLHPSNWSKEFKAC